MKEMPLLVVAKELENYIADLFDSYEKETTINIEKTVEKVANDFANELKTVTPVSDTSGGKYGHIKNNINVKTETKNGKKRYVVNFGKKAYLSTLLEFGWTTKNGISVRRQAFIRPLFDRNKDRYFKQIKEAVERGGDNV